MICCFINIKIIPNKKNNQIDKINIIYKVYFMKDNLIVLHNFKYINFHRFSNTQLFIYCFLKNVK